MNAYQLLNALGEIDDWLLMDVKPHSKKRKEPVRRGWILLAAVITALALCGFGIYQALSDQWLQNPSQNPVETVKSAIQNQAEKPYTLAVKVEQIAIDKEETARTAARYKGSDLAQARGWTDAYLDEHFVAVRAEYWVTYDHTQTFLDDGRVCQYFYLTRDPQTGRWTIADNITAPQNQHPEG